jgi:hypothetical protein
MANKSTTSPGRTPDGIVPKGPEVTRHLFGGVLVEDGAGHYPGLELLNLVFRGEADDLLPRKGTTFRLRSHDFARKLVWSDEFPRHPARRSVLLNGHTEDAIRHLLECLQLEIPNQAKKADWARAHFFPYTRSLIHWDARNPKRGAAGSAVLERRYLRGGGALAYRVLRADPDEERRSRCQGGFESLYPSSADSPLGALAEVLAGHGVSQSEPKPDLIEAQCSARDDALEELYREGMVTILGQVQISSVSRIRAVMAWTGFWLVTMQHSRAYSSLGRPPAAIICDCGANHQQLRRAAQKSFKDAQSVILDAVDAGFAELSKSDKKLPQRQRNSIWGFCWSTAATVGILNARRGRRHFTLGLDILETLVFAGIPRGEEKPFEWFVDDWLYQRCGIVVGRRAAEQEGLLADLDASIFEDNETQLQDQMAAAGLLRQYSDATRMVGAEEIS